MMSRPSGTPRGVRVTPVSARGNMTSMLCLLLAALAVTIPGTFASPPAEYFYPPAAPPGFDEANFADMLEIGKGGGGALAVVTFEYSPHSTQGCATATQDGFINYTVVMPFHNEKEALIRMSLQSVQESAQYFASTKRACGEVIIVDDLSRPDAHDTLLSVVEQQHPWTSAFLRIVVVRTNKNVGLSGARNTGASFGSSPVLMWCDSDDRFLKNHIQVCVDTIGIDYSLGYLRTRVKPSVQVHMDWEDRIGTTLALSLCVRRSTHYFVGGYPESDLFRKDYEDIHYEMGLRAFQLMNRYDQATVEYHWYPGNHFDKQLEKFQRPLNDPPPEKEMSVEEKKRPLFGWLAMEQHLVKIASQLKAGIRRDLAAEMLGGPLPPIEPVSIQSKTLAEICTKIMLSFEREQAIRCLLNTLRVDSGSSHAWMAVGDLLMDDADETDPNKFPWDTSYNVYWSAVALDEDHAEAHIRFAVAITNHDYFSRVITPNTYRRARHHMNRANDLAPHAPDVVKFTQGLERDVLPAENQFRGQQ